MIVDTSEATSGPMNHLRDAVAGFFDALPAGEEALLASTGRRVQVRVPPTTDHAALRGSAASLTSDLGPTALLDALHQIDDRFMRTARDRRPVWILLTGDGVESSTPADVDWFNAWLPSLRARGHVAHALVFKTGNGMPETIARLLAQSTGGHFETVGAGAMLPARFKALVELINR